MRHALLPLALLGLATLARAQSLDPTPETTPAIELDGSIGPGGEVPFANDTWQIGDDLGEYRGQSLFHSFGRFDVPSGQSAEFSAAQGVPHADPGAPYEAPQRVFARVTWGERSDIEGRLASSIPGADLYLLNPAGVRFVGGAQLDVQGSFHAASVGRVEFPSGARFVTNAAEPLPLLEYAEPSAYGFLPEGGGAIEFGLLDQSSLHVPAGETFAAVGGNVRIRGGGRPTFESPDSTIALVAGGPDVSVPLPDLARFVPPAGVPLGSIDISLGSSLYVAPSAAGSVVARGGSFSLSEGSFILAVHDAAEDTRYPLAVDVEVRDELRISGFSGIQAGTLAAGRGGDVRLSGGAIEISGSEIRVATAGLVEPGAGVGSDVLVRGTSLELSQAGHIWNQSLGTGAGGAIDIEVGALSLVSGGYLLSEAGYSGDGGPIQIRAESLTASGAGANGISIGSTTLFATDPDHPEAAGSAGAIEIAAGQIALRDGAQILSSTPGWGNTGNVRLRPAAAAGGLSLHASNGVLIGTTTQGGGRAGNVSIEASDGALDSLTLEGGPDGPSRITALALSSEADPRVGDAGDIRVETDRLSLRNGGQITASTNGTGDAGRVEVLADTVEMRGALGGNQSGLYAQSLGEILAIGGQAGGIALTATGDVSLADGARIFVETRSDKPAGDITLRSGGRVELDAASISARSLLEDSPARSGSIRVEAAEGIFLSNGSVIGSRSFSEGRAGQIFIDAGPVLEVTDSELSTESTTLADAGGGTIEVVAEERIVLTDASINTSVETGGGDGGNVNIDPDLLVLNRSEIRADAIDGNGGAVFIRAGTFVLSEGSAVTADSLGEGDPGIVVIESPEADLASERAQPAQEFLDAAGLLRTACGAASETSSFVVERVAGLPASPEGPLPAPLWDALGASPLADAGSGARAGAADRAPRLPAAALAAGCAAREGSG